MTLSELRGEYKQLEPLGDERDNLLPSQINAQTGKSEPPPPAMPVTNQQPNTQPNDNQNTPEDANNVPMKAELNRWKRLALRTFGKSQPKFDNILIPDNMARTIAVKLKACKNVLEIADVFENVTIPVPKQNDAALVLEGIRLALTK